MKEYFKKKERRRVSILVLMDVSLQQKLQDCILII